MPCWRPAGPGRCWSRSAHAPGPTRSPPPTPGSRRRRGSTCFRPATTMTYGSMAPVWPGIAAGRRSRSTAANPAPPPGGAPRPVYGVSATAAIYRRDALVAVSPAGRPLRPFNERLESYYEDVELADRLRRASYEAVLAPAARIEHAGALSSRGRRAARRRVRRIYCNRLLVLAARLGREFLAAAAGTPGPGCGRHAPGPEGRNPCRAIHDARDLWISCSPGAARSGSCRASPVSAAHSRGRRPGATTKAADDRHSDSVRGGAALARRGQPRAPHQELGPATNASN